MEQNTKQPHELEKQPNQKNGKGMVAALVIVIILAIVAVGGTWYYMNNQAKNDKKAQDAQIQQLQKQVEELNKSKEQAVQTNDPNLLTYEVIGTPLALKYPKGWYTLACPREQGDVGTTDFLASAESYLGVCNSDAPSQVYIATSKNVKNIQENSGGVSSNVTINGINMKRHEAPSNQPYVPGSDYIYVKQVQYFFEKNGIYYSIGYVQSNKTPDVYSDFEKIVNSITVN